MALFANQLIKGHHIVQLKLWDYSIYDSWNTYQEIKTVHVDRFVTIFAFGATWRRQLYIHNKKEGRSRATETEREREREAKGDG